jgi:hypothetical protein
MIDGFEEQREYKEALLLETHRLLRYIGYTNYIAIPTKKGTKKARLQDYYPLPYDKKKKGYTKLEIDRYFSKMDSLITNGKFRGYLDGEKLYNKEKEHIGYYRNETLEYIN